MARTPLGAGTWCFPKTANDAARSWPEFANIHPFAPDDQTAGYRHLIDDLSAKLCRITGYDALSMQPNSGAQGEYAGLLTIRNYHIANGEGHRNVCLIPMSAHGTNPATTSMAGLEVDAVMTGHCGPKAFRVLDAAGIQIYLGAEGTVEAALNDFRAGKYQPANKPDVEGHW